jgi:hypothetical protein
MIQLKLKHFLKTFLNISFFIALFFILSSNHNLWAYQIANKNIGESLIWKNVFGGHDIEYLNSLISLPNNQHVIVGSSGSYIKDGAWESIWILKIDDHGKIITENIIGSSSYNSGNTIIFAPDNHLMIGGEKNWLYCSACHEIGKAWIAMVDYKLDIIWEKTFNVEGNSRVLDMCTDNKEGFGMVGVSQIDRSGASKAWFAYADWTGNIVHDNTYNYLFQDKATGIINLGNNGFIICGYSQTSNLSESIAWILKTDENGEVQWKQEFKTNIGINVLQRIIELDKENFIAIGHTSAKGSGWQDGWVIKLNSNGEILWDKTYGTKNKDIFTSAVKQDNNIIIAGTTFVPIKNTTDGWIVKIDKNGELLWNKTYGGEKGESFNGINIHNNDILYLFGSSSPAQSDSLNKDGLIFKIRLSQ